MNELELISRESISNWVWRFCRRGILLLDKGFQYSRLIIWSSLIWSLLHSSLWLTLRYHFSMSIESMVHGLFRFNFFDLAWPDYFCFFMSNFSIHKVGAGVLSILIITEDETLTASVWSLLLFFAFIFESSWTCIHWNWISNSLIKGHLCAYYWNILIIFIVFWCFARFYTQITSWSIIYFP